MQQNHQRMVGAGGGGIAPQAHANQPGNQSANPHGSVGRQWLGIQWECCSAYGRLYKRADGTAYEGRCPRCGTAARVAVGPSGSGQRFFKAG